MLIARETHTMAPSYEQNTLKRCEIHGTMNLRFKWPVHEGYIHVHHICNPTPHSHIPILPHNVTHRTLQAADLVTTASAIAQGQVVELPQMQQHNTERTPGTHVAQARCSAGRRRNYRVFACVNAPICVPTLLSSPPRNGPFAHAKGCFCALARKTVNAQNCNLRTQKGVFASQV